MFNKCSKMLSNALNAFSLLEKREKKMQNYVEAYLKC